VFAQASITGVIRDSSGAVLPGVTVEAASPVLIEKARSVVTDGTGQYRIEDLRPGAYTVTFTLPGFSTVRRDGIQLTGSFVATVNAEMRVGAVEETLTVTGEAPIVDVQSVTQQRVLGKEVLDSIPTGRSHFTAAILIPGMTGTRDVGGANNLALTTMAIHGGESWDTRVMVDGISTQNAENAGNSSNYMSNMGATQEVSIDYAAGSAEQAYAGLRINLIPRDGGNTYSGSFFGTYANGRFEADNYTSELEARGLRAPNALKRVYDFNPVFGGPLKQDKLWFFAGARWVENNKYTAGLFYNKNAGNPEAWTYEPDFGRQAFDRITQQSGNARLTWQAASRHKFSFFYDQQGRCWCNWPSGGLLSPEATYRLEWPKNRLTTASWSSPLTSRLLLEGRFSDRSEMYDYTDKQPDGSKNFPLIQVTEQSTGITYRAMGGRTTQPFESAPARVWQASANASYVTGAHAFKFGFSDVWMLREVNIGGDRDMFHMAYRFNNGIPNLIWQRATPWSHTERQKAELGIFAQDRWTVDRLTLNLGVRYDWYNSYYPEQHLGPAPLVPTRDLTFPRTDGLNFHDITPRIGVAYDVFGNGSTAVKANVGKYPIAVGIAQGVFGEQVNPAWRLANTVSRSWNDANRNYLPECDLLILEANGECGRVDNLNFGKPVPSTTYDERITTGWGNRQYQWEFSAGVQQAIAPRVSMNVGYFRRVFGNFLVTDNVLVDPSDYGAFSITAPADTRLPNGGGYAITDLYNLNPDKVGVVNNLLRPASDFGRQIRHWNGVDLTVDARVRSGVVLQGGLSTGRTSTDNCDVVAKVDNPSALYCHIDTNFLTQVKFLGAYTVPVIDLQLAATFQSLPGPEVAANYNAPNAVVAPSLGRNLSGGAANVTINLVEPGTMYGERSNQLDFRLGRMFRIDRFRATLNLDLYNALNGSAVLTQNNNFAAWQIPTSILSARLAKFSLQLDF
jgi:hypothetical protein